MRVGVVIQGPVNSRGFDAVANVRRIADSYSALPACGPLVLSTWEGEDAPLRHPGLTVLLNRPVERDDAMNRLRQWRSTYEGIKFLRANTEVTHILKLRTDMYVAPEIIDFMVDFYARAPGPEGRMRRVCEGCLLGSHVHRGVPFGVGDFYFAGRAGDMERLFGDALSFGGLRFQDNAEADIWARHLARALAGDLPPWWRLIGPWWPPRVTPDDPIFGLWLEVYRECVAPFPRKFLEGAAWRGKPFVEGMDERATFGRGREVLREYFDFHEEWLRMRNDQCGYLAMRRETFPFGLRASYWVLNRQRAAVRFALWGWAGSRAGLGWLWGVARAPFQGMVAGARAWARRGYRARFGAAPDGDMGGRGHGI